MKKIILLLLLSTGMSATSTYEKWIKKKEELIALQDMLMEKVKYLPANKEKFDSLIKEYIKEKLAEQNVEASDQRCEEEFPIVLSDINGLADSFFKNKNESLIPADMLFTSTRNFTKLHMLKLLLIRYMLEVGEIYYLIEKINNCAKELNAIDNICLTLEKKFPEQPHQS